MPFMGPPSRRARSKRSEWVMPRPAVIQLTSPGRIACSTPKLSRCMISPAKRYVTVDSPICGCGLTSADRGTFGGNRMGPIWSKKMKGPIMRRLAKGRTRPTSKAPSDRRRASMIISSTEVSSVARREQRYFASIAPEQHDALLPEPVGESHRIQSLRSAAGIQHQRPLDGDPELGGHVFEIQDRAEMDVGSVIPMRRQHLRGRHAPIEKQAPADTPVTEIRK